MVVILPVSLMMAGVIQVVNATVKTMWNWTFVISVKMATGTSLRITLLDAKVELSCVLNVCVLSECNRFNLCRITITFTIFTMLMLHYFLYRV